MHVIRVCSNQTCWQSFTSGSITRPRSALIVWQNLGPQCVMRWRYRHHLCHAPCQIGLGSAQAFPDENSVIEANLKGGWPPKRARRSILWSKTQPQPWWLWSFHEAFGQICPRNIIEWSGLWRHETPITKLSNCGCQQPLATHGRR